MDDQTPYPESVLGVRVDDVKERALEFAATAREQFSGATRSLKEYIVKEPTRAVGVALGMGVLLGWLIKRR
jgi:ElaB/YqjD/DUF883 family membrane-anchored ribosome-binding protein